MLMIRFEEAEILQKLSISVIFYNEYFHMHNRQFLGK